MNAFLPYSRQEISAEDIEAVVRVLKSDWLTTGPELEAFERELAEFCGARYAVACASGTAALHLAMLALGAGEDTQMVTTPVTFLATANSARFVGAGVRFADIEPETANLDPEKVEPLLAALPGQETVLVPVHFAGQPARMAAFVELADRYQAQVIEDGCHALGAAYQDEAGRMRRVGSCCHSRMTVFSFHPVKSITTGEGGAVTTNDPRLAERLRRFRNHGLRRQAPAAGWQQPAEALADDGVTNPWYYEMEEPGFNYRLSDIQCALGRSQLARLEQFLARRRQLAALYHQQLAASKLLAELVQPLTVSPGVRHGWHLFVVRIDFGRAGITRAELMHRLRSRGIGSQVHYLPLHLQPYYRQLLATGRGALPVAEAYYDQCLSLPFFPAMSDDDVNRVVTALEAILVKRRKG